VDTDATLLSKNSPHTVASRLLGPRWEVEREPAGSAAGATRCRATAHRLPRPSSAARYAYALRLRRSGTGRIIGEQFVFAQDQQGGSVGALYLGTGVLWKIDLVARHHQQRHQLAG